MKYKSDHCIIGEDCLGDYILHHVKTRKSGGKDNPENLMPLCVKHHQIIHWDGLTKFCMKYKKAEEWLIKNGHEIIMGRWK